MNSKSASNLLPYPVIVLMASGDVDAINTALSHYEGYIAALSTKQFKMQAAHRTCALMNPYAVVWKRS